MRANVYCKVPRFAPFEILEDRQLLAVLGDFNGDLCRDSQDIDLLSRELRAGTADSSFDLNGDSRVDELDRTTWVRRLRATSFGDANIDGLFDSSDLVEVFLADEFEDNIAGNSAWATGDWNGDGDFDTSDLVIAFQDNAFEEGFQGPVVPLDELHTASFCGDRKDFTAFRFQVTTPETIYLPPPSFESIEPNDGLLFGGSSMTVFTPSGRLIFPDALNTLITADEPGEYKVLATYQSTVAVNGEFQTKRLPDAIPIAFDTAIDGLINPDQPTVFEIQGEPGDRFVIRHAESKSQPAQVFTPDNRFTNPTGSEPDGAFFGLAFELESSDPYKIVIFEPGGPEYNFQLITEKVNYSTIRINEDVEGAIERNGQYDVVRFSAERGDRLVFDHFAGDLFNLAYLVAPSGERLATIPLSSFSQPIPVLPETGRYELFVNTSLFFDETSFGSYGFWFVDLAEVGKIDLGDTISASLTPATKASFVAFEGKSGNRVRISTDNDGANLSLTVISPGGNVVGRRFELLLPERPLSVMLPEDGRYHLIIEALDNPSDDATIDFSIGVELI